MHAYLSFLFVYCSLYLASAIGLLAAKNTLLKGWKGKSELLLTLNVIVGISLVTLTLFILIPDIIKTTKVLKQKYTKSEVFK